MRFMVFIRGVARNLFWGGIKVFWGGIKCSITVLTSLLPHKKFTWPVGLIMYI